MTTVENKIPSINNLARKTALTTVKNEIPSISGLVEKTDNNTEITDIENKVNNHNHDKYSHDSDPTLKKCLFGAVTLTKNADIEKYKYSGYGIGFDRSSVSFTSGGFGQNVLMFGADMSTSIHIDNKKKNILVLGRGPTQGLKSTLTAEKMYSINFTVTKKKFCLSLHYNGSNGYLFFNGTEICKFKAKDSAIVASPLCLGNISKDWSTNNMKKSGLTGYVYDFTADYNAVTLDNIKDIHKYLMKKMI